MTKILVVDDDLEMREELAILLENNGYEVEAVDNFRGSESKVLNSGADLVLLDINLPEMNGEMVLRKMREKSTMPVIMLTGRDNEVDEMLSMSYGADDFIAKPFNPNILLLRIEAVLRRAGERQDGRVEVQPNVGDIVEYKEMKYDVGKGEISGGGRKLDLTRTEMLILGYLLDNKNRIVSREKLMTLLWDNTNYINDSTLTVNISRLRDKLEKVGLKDAIVTRKGQGYILG